MFADRRAMRPASPGVLASSDLTVPNEGMNDPDLLRVVDDRLDAIATNDPIEHDRIVLGIEPQANGQPGPVAKIPVPVTMDLMRRGQERFNVYCAPCHGLSGYGDGMVARRAADMQAAGADTASGWVAPITYHSDELRNRPVGSLYNTIHNGVRTMPAYGGQVSVMDRWAIVAYVKALQRSQNAKPEDVPETERQKLGK
jgi:mono/diheme cytochrome c family protein